MKTYNFIVSLLSINKLEKCEKGVPLLMKTLKENCSNNTTDGPGSKPKTMND